MPVIAITSRTSLLNALRGILLRRPAPVLTATDTRNAGRSSCFEAAYQVSVKARTETMNCGLVYIADLIRKQLPTATRITVDAEVRTLDAIHADETQLWARGDRSDRIFSCGTADDIEGLLRDMTSFGQDIDDLTDAGWLAVDLNDDKFDILLPEVVG